MYFIIRRRTFMTNSNLYTKKNCNKKILAIDVSLCKQHNKRPTNGTTLYTCKEGGYVWRFATKVHSVQWKLNTISACKFNFRWKQQRVNCQALHCHQSHGSKLTSDFFNGGHASCWSRDALVEEYYNKRLASSNSARLEGHKYAPRCPHFSL